MIPWKMVKTMIIIRGEVMKVTMQVHIKSNRLNEPGRAVLRSGLSGMNTPRILRFLNSVPLYLLLLLV